MILDLLFGSAFLVVAYVAWWIEKRQERKRFVVPKGKVRVGK